MQSTLGSRSSKEHLLLGALQKEILHPVGAQKFLTENGALSPTGWVLKLQVSLDLKFKGAFDSDRVLGVDVT